MRPPAASVIIWHTSIFSFLSLAKIVCFITSAKKVTGLPNKRLEKSVCSVTMGLSWSSGVPVACGHGVALEKGFARVRSTVDFGRGGKWTAKLNAGQEDFWKFWAHYRHQHKIDQPQFLVWEFQFFFGILGRFSHSPSDCHCNWDILGQQRCIRYIYVPRCR